MKQVCEFCEQQFNLILLSVLFLCLVGACLHLHGDGSAQHIQDLLRWVETEAAGVLGAILLAITSQIRAAAKREPKPPDATVVQ